MARICIVTPGQLGSNPRAVKEAHALTAAGHDVTVIATRVLDAVEPRDQSVMAMARWRVERLDFSKAWQRRADRVLQIAAGKLHGWTGNAALAPFAHSEMSRRLARAAIRTPADLYIAHYPAALPAAARAARRHGTRFAFDAEDFHPGDLPDEPVFDAARRAVTAIERRFLPDAAYVSAASPGIAEAYRETYGIALPATILNVFARAGAPAALAPLEAHRAAPSLYWFSQTIGPDRGLESAITALALTKSKPHLFLRGMVTPGMADRLGSLATAARVPDRLTLLPPDSPGDMERLAARHTLGLASEIGTTRNRRIALTNKQFTYLLAGLPVLMSDIPAHRAFAEEAPGAVFLYQAGDAASLATAIDSLLGDPEALQRARLAAFDLGQTRFNWESEQQKLVVLVANALASTPA